jgi:hypothetical protein
MPLQRFQILLDPGQLRAMRAIERQNGARIATQVRFAVAMYLRKQTVISQREVERQWKQAK